VDTDHLMAALSAYLLVGVFWGAIYVAVEEGIPGSLLAAGSRFPHGMDLSDGIYFSFVTLATLGYGDITPVTPIARGLAVFEAVVGQFYLAVLVARLVGLRTVAETGDGARGS
jgi:voltage-gated potassium channel Kch